MSTTTAKSPPSNLNLSDWPYRFAIVRLDDLHLEKYQRPLSESWLKGREFNPALFGAATVSERAHGSKAYALIDGQHRCAIARTAELEEVPALVFYDLTIEQESELFSMFQRERRSITPIVRFNADVISKHPDALAIKRIATANGFEITDLIGAGKIRAVASLERVYAETDGPEKLGRVLALIGATWPEMPEAASMQMIRGLSLFLDQVESIDDDRFVSRLERYTPSDLSRKASNLRDIHGNSGTIARFAAEIIANHYHGRASRS